VMFARRGLLGAAEEWVRKFKRGRA
jgi:hypothetical protein